MGTRTRVRQPQVGQVSQAALVVQLPVSRPDAAVTRVREATETDVTDDQQIREVVPQDGDRAQDRVLDCVSRILYSFVFGSASVIARGREGKVCLITSCRQRDTRAARVCREDSRKHREKKDRLQAECLDQGIQVLDQPLQSVSLHLWKSRVVGVTCLSFGVRIETVAG